MPASSRSSTRIFFCQSLCIFLCFENSTFFSVSSVTKALTQTVCSAPTGMGEVTPALLSLSLCLSVLSSLFLSLSVHLHGALADTHFCTLLCVLHAHTRWGAAATQTLPLQTNVFAWCTYWMTLCLSVCVPDLMHGMIRKKGHKLFFN